MQVFRVSTEAECPLPLADKGVKAGFPSPAQDFMELPLDFNKDMVKNPLSSFYAVVEGDSMIGAGIAPGDLLLVDRSLDPRDGCIAICALNGEFLVKRLRLRPGEVVLISENARYAPVVITEEDSFEVWAVAIRCIKKLY